MSLSARELIEWMIFERVEGFGESRANIRSAVLACILANVHRKKGARAFRLQDFLPNPGPAQQPAQTQAQQLAVLRQWAAALKRQPSRRPDGPQQTRSPTPR